MLTFLFFSALALVAFATGGLFLIPFLIVGAVIWLITLPFRLLFGGLFRLIFGIGGALLGIVLAPLILVVVAIAVVGAFVAAVLALLTPLIPVMLLVLFGWGVYRIARPRPAF
jgi:hypothetical protein